MAADRVEAGEMVDVAADLAAVVEVQVQDRKDLQAVAALVSMWEVAEVAAWAVLQPPLVQM